MSDFELFNTHFGTFTTVFQDYTRIGEVGHNNGLNNVKGFTDDVEVLTSQGWLLFEQVGDILLKEQQQYETWSQLYQTGKQMGVMLEKDRELLRTRYSYQPLLVASVTPYHYNEQPQTPSTGERKQGRPKGTTIADELAKSGGTGRVVFVQPTGFYQWNYDRVTLRLKMRGIDVTGSMWADYPVKRKYKPGYRFMRAAKMWENKYPEYYYLMLNNFSENIGEHFHPAKTIITTPQIRDWWWGDGAETGNPNTPTGNTQHWWGYRTGEQQPPSRKANQGKAWFLEEVTKTFTPKTIIPTQIFVKGRGAKLYPAENIKQNNNYSGNVYNLTAPPHKTLIVRKQRPQNKNPNKPSRKHWEGLPLVVGDMSNKHTPPNGGYRKPGTHTMW